MIDHSIIPWNSFGFFFRFYKYLNREELTKVIAANPHYINDIPRPVIYPIFEEVIEINHSVIYHTYDPPEDKLIKIISKKPGLITMVRSPSTSLIKIALRKDPYLIRHFYAYMHRYTLISTALEENARCISEIPGHWLDWPILRKAKDCLLEQGNYETFITLKKHHKKLKLIKLWDDLKRSLYVFKKNVFNVLRKK